MLTNKSKTEQVKTETESLSKIDKLKEIKKGLRFGELKVLSKFSRVNEGQLSVYLNKAGIAVLKPAVVERILIGYEKFRQ